MYENIGDKIKAVAVIGCILEIIACVIVGISLISNSSSYNHTATAGWIIMIVGSLGAWIGSFCLYGFGELIEKTCANNATLIKMESELTDLKKKLSTEANKSIASVIDTNNTASHNNVRSEPVVIVNNTNLSDKRIDAELDRQEEERKELTCPLKTKFLDNISDADTMGEIEKVWNMYQLGDYYPEIEQKIKRAVRSEVVYGKSPKDVKLLIEQLKLMLVNQ